MIQSYILWALLGMAGYSFMTLFVKLAERSGEASTYMVLAVSTSIVVIFAIATASSNRSCSSSSGRHCCGPSQAGLRSPSP